MNLFACLKDGVCGSDKLGQFGMGEDSVVGVNFQTDSQDHWRGGLQGLAHAHTHTHRHSLENSSTSLIMRSPSIKKIFL